jgi:hypothetical protein
VEVPIRALAVLTLGAPAARDQASAGRVAPAARDQASAGQVAPAAPDQADPVVPDQASAGPDQVATDPAFMGQAGRQPSAGISADRAI